MVRDILNLIAPVDRKLNSLSFIRSTFLIGITVFFGGGFKKMTDKNKQNPMVLLSLQIWRHSICFLGLINSKKICFDSR